MDKIEKFLSEHVAIIKPLSKQLALTYWNASISGDDKDFAQYESIAKEIKNVYNKKEDFEKVKELLSEAKDQMIKRQLEILYNAYLSSQGDIDLIKEIVSKETKIEQKFNKFRANLEGKELTDNQIKDILKTETDSEKLKAAWEASKKQGELVEKEMIEVIKLRNKLAQDLGFKNYYDYSLEFSEQKTGDIMSIFRELTEATEKPFKEMKDELDSFLSKKCGLQKEELKPWHYQDLFFQEISQSSKIDLDEIYSHQDIVKIAEQFYKSIGLPASKILEKSSLYEKPGKSQHAFCVSVDREGDVRVLENVKNDEKWMDTTLHELGHAVYSTFACTEKLPFLLRDQAHIFTTEAIALLFGRNSKNASFIKRYCGFDQTAIEKIKIELNKSSKLRQLIFSRWTQVMVNFERLLYENPGQNLNRLWWDLVKKYQGINFSRDKPDWASKIHFVSAPVYYHNYALGELLASQIHVQIARKILGQKSLKNVDYSGNVEIGNYLKTQIFELGCMYKWDRMILKATGENLTSKYFIEEFVSQPINH